MLTWKFNFFMGQIRGFLLLTMLYFMYNAVLADKTQVFGYNAQKLNTYVMLAGIVSSFTQQYIMFALSDGIIRGDINQLLLKPINLFSFYFLRLLPNRVADSFFAVIWVGFFVFLIKPQVNFPTTPLPYFLLVFFSFLGALLFNLIDSTAGLVTFWLSHPGGFLFVVRSLVEQLSGRLFPFELIAGFSGIVLSWLPVGYFAYYPVKIFLTDSPTTSDILTPMVIGLGWVGAWFLIFNVVLKKGLKVYGAYGI